MIPFEFVLFALTLLGVALFHSKTLLVALVGLAAVLVYELGFTDFDLARHFAREWRLLFNLLGLLLGFAVLAGHFERSGVPQWLPRVLPDDWRGGFALLVVVFVMSAILDNIAAALIGVTIARVVFRDRVHVGYLASIVAAANAGGAPSVVGDTTTTMIWLAGASPLRILPALLASMVALFVFGIIGAKQQDRHQRILRDARAGVHVDPIALLVVVSILAGAVLANVYFDHQPALGVWTAIILTAPLRRPHGSEIRNAAPGALFLVALVFTASMMPVERLPTPSWQTTLGLGFVSAVFDNIPLTKLALEQNGFDWALLAFAVGFGGSMIWFGSSAGVACANICPHAKSIGAWLRYGWHVIFAYVLGFFTLLIVRGWNPDFLTKQ